MSPFDDNEKVVFEIMGLPDPNDVSGEVRRAVLAEYWKVDGDGRVGWTRASRDSAYLLEKLQPACKRVSVAGSIRRRKPRVGDIEIVAEPILQGAPSLFDQQQISIEIALDEMVQSGRLKRGEKDGERYKRLYVWSPLGDGGDWLKVDLFIVRPPAQWGVIMAIRTGPAEFSKWLVTDVRQGGARCYDMKFENGALWRNGAVIETPDEGVLFQELGLKWVEPWNRTKEAVQVGQK